MIYLDIVTIHTPEERLIRRGGMMIREQYQAAKRYLRLKDDRRPGEELLMPLEKLDDLVPQFDNQLLLEPF